MSLIGVAVNRAITSDYFHESLISGVVSNLATETAVSKNDCVLLCIVWFTQDRLGVNDRFLVTDWF